MKRSQKQKIVCFGGVCSDIKAIGQSELVLETSNSVNCTTSIGGVAKNIAETLARLGIEVSLISKVGDDKNGQFIREFLSSLSIDTEHVIQATNRLTASYTTLLHPTGEMLISIADMSIFDEMPESVIESAIKRHQKTPYWVIDANLSDNLIQKIVSEAPKECSLWAMAVSCAKAKRFNNVLSRLDMLCLNVRELESLVNRPCQNLDEIKNAADILLQQGVKNIVVTLGERGALFHNQSESIFCKAPQASVVDVTGAGDALASGLLYARCMGIPWSEALKIAIASAYLAIQTYENVDPEITHEKIQQIAKIVEETVGSRSK